jgi:hypothetical protein
MTINASCDYSFTFLTEYDLPDLKYSNNWLFVDGMKYKIYLNKGHERYSYRADSVGIIEGTFGGDVTLITAGINLTYNEFKILKKKTKPVEFIKIS